MSAISTTYDNTAYATDPSLYGATTATAGGEGDFEAVLGSQLATGEQSGSGEAATISDAATSAEQLALASYDAGQVTAYALSQSSEEAVAESETTAAAETSETSSSEETAEGEGAGDAALAGGAGWPGDGTKMAEWIPSGMQFYDELTGQWVNDDIPHRINDNGDLEYCWEGQWFLDTAVSHRMADAGSQSETAAAQGTEAGGETGGDATASLDGGGPYEVQYYYNADLAQWKLFNFPTRASEDGTSQYYWQDQWWTDNWDHNYAATDTALAAATDTTSDTAADSAAAAA